MKKRRRRRRKEEEEEEKKKKKNSRKCVDDELNMKCTERIRDAANDHEKNLSLKVNDAIV